MREWLQSLTSAMIGRDTMPSPWMCLKVCGYVIRVIVCVPVYLGWMAIKWTAIRIKELVK